MKKLVYVLGIALLASCGMQDHKHEAKVATEEVKIDSKSGATESKIPTNAKTAFKVDGMVCSKGCAPKIQDAVNAVEGVGKSYASYKKRVVFVKYDSTLTNKDAITTAINNIEGGGVYTATALTKEECKAVCEKTCDKGSKKCDWTKKCTKDSASCAKYKAECKAKCEAEGKECKFADAKSCEPGCEKACCANKDAHQCSEACAKEGCKAKTGEDCKPGCEKECCKKE